MSTASAIERVVDGASPIAVHRNPGGWSSDAPQNAIMLSGSFRPVHRAHRALLRIATRVAGENREPCFEISVRNVEKPDIGSADLHQRVSQFGERGDTVVITRAATFLEKARLMPGTTFVIGFDTAIRLFDDRFYNDVESPHPSIEAMSELRELGSRFIVGGRHDADGVFRTISDIDTPSGFESLLIPIPEKQFSDPISSTQIRESQKSG